MTEPTPQPLTPATTISTAGTTWPALVAAATSTLRACDPVMATAIERVGPCTLVPNPKLFETIVESIVSQQISVKAADAIMARLCAALPDGQPTPAALLTLDHDALRAVGLSTFKARYIRDLTERVSSGQLDLEALTTLEDEAVIQALTQVKGIGRWTAEMMLIFSLGRPDVLPVDDLGFVEGVRSAYGLENRPKPSEMRARGELWRPYRTFATWYMWGWRRVEMATAKEKTRLATS